jgi:hypothetical protein
MAPGLRDGAVMCRGHRIADVVSPRFATSSAVASREAPNTSARSSSIICANAVGSRTLSFDMRRAIWIGLHERPYVFVDAAPPWGYCRPTSYARPDPLEAWHEASPLPAREPAPLDVLSGVRDAACSPLLEVRNTAARRGDVLRVHERARPGSAGSPRRSLPPRSWPAPRRNEQAPGRRRRTLPLQQYREIDIVSGLSRKTE